jgi:hypothetical protein
MLGDGKKLPGALKILHCPFVFLRRSQAAECAEVLALAGFSVFFSRIKPVFTGF